MRRLWHRRWWEPERFWGAARGDWWCLHPGQPAEETWPAQRSFLSRSGPQLWTNQRKKNKLYMKLWVQFLTWHKKDMPSILSRYYSLFSKKDRSKTSFMSLTQTGACVGSLHYGLLVQHRALRQWQISSHPCNRDPTEEASYHITSTTVPFQRMSPTCTLLQLKINRHHHVSYRPWNVIGRIPPRALQLSHSVTVLWAAAAENSPDGHTHLPSNLCFRKSNKAFCIMSVT